MRESKGTCGERPVGTRHLRRERVHGKDKGPSETCGLTCWFSSRALSRTLQHEHAKGAGLAGEGGGGRSRRPGIGRGAWRHGKGQAACHYTLLPPVPPKNRERTASASVATEVVGSQASAHPTRGSARAVTLRELISQATRVSSSGVHTVLLWRAGSTSIAMPGGHLHLSGGPQPRGCNIVHAGPEWTVYTDSSHSTNAIGGAVICQRIPGASVPRQGVSGGTTKKGESAQRLQPAAPMPGHTNQPTNQPQTERGHCRRQRQAAIHSGVMLYTAPGSPKGLIHNLLMQFFTLGSSKIEVFETCFYDIVIT